MLRWIPERPSYKKERRTVGFMALFLFLLLFLCRLLKSLVPFGHIPWLFLPFTAAVALLLPATVYLIFRGKGYSASLRLFFPGGRYVPLMIAAFFALFSGSILLSRLTGGTATLGNTVIAFDTVYGETVWETLLLFAGAAVLPAIFESLVFGGILMVEYERRGAVRAILMSALLFSLLHFDLSNLLSYLFAGALLALVVYATNSLFAAMILHVLYNVLSLFSQHYLNALYDHTGTIQLYLFIFIVTFLVSLLLFCRACARIYRVRDERRLDEPRRAVPYQVQFYTVLDALCDPAILICFGLAIAGFIIF